MGSYVPADCAELYCLDGVYTRMGAGDDLAADMSTFMVRGSYQGIRKPPYPEIQFMYHESKVANNETALTAAAAEFMFGSCEDELVCMCMARPHACAYTV